MRPTAIFALFFLLATFSQNVARSEEPDHGPLPRLVALTAFEPFDGSNLNGSQIIAEILKQSPDLVRQRIELHVCILPVEYGRAAEVAKRCILALGRRPLMVISTGESSCAIGLETRFHNLEHSPSTLDNAGVRKINSVITPGGEAELPSTLPLADMYCSLRSRPAIAVRPSNDGGNFVCNSTAYRLQAEMLTVNLPYGFIHVPNSSCGAFAHAEAARALGEMIVGGADALDSWHSTQSRGTRIPRLPTSAAEVARAAEEFRGVNPEHSCGALFYRDLVREYQELNPQPAQNRSATKKPQTR